MYNMSRCKNEKGTMYVLQCSQMKTSSRFLSDKELGLTLIKPQVVPPFQVKKQGHMMDPDELKGGHPYSSGC